MTGLDDGVGTALNATAVGVGFGDKNLSSGCISRRMPGGELIERVSPCGDDGACKMRLKSLEISSVFGPVTVAIVSEEAI